MGKWLAGIEESLKGKAAVITGGARGIGKEIAAAFASEGVHVALLDVLEEEGTAAAQELEGMGARSLFYKMDITDARGVEEVVDKVASEFGSVHILVNNAGVTRDGLLLRMKEVDWDLVLGINLKGAFNGIKAAARHMTKQRWGRIVNIASIIGIIGNQGQSNYSASKAGLIGLTKSCAKEFASRGITVNAVAPGFITTEMTERLPEKVQKEILSRIPLGRFGSAQDVAGVVLLLASSIGNYITGQVIIADGGMVV